MNFEATCRPYTLLSRLKETRALAGNLPGTARDSLAVSRCPGLAVVLVLVLPLQLQERMP